MSRREVEIIPTYVPRSAEELAKYARSIIAFSPAIHIDIVDGIFASSYTWPYVKQGSFGAFDLSGVADLTAEIHLMVEEPREIGLMFARAGAYRIIGHAEAFEDAEHMHGALDLWREGGARQVGLGLLMHTPIEVVELLSAKLDVLQLMTIATIGRQGVPYDEGAPARVAEARARFPEVLLSVDGGVSAGNIEVLARAGAQRFCAGSAISKAPDPAAEYRKLKSLALAAHSSLQV